MTRLLSKKKTEPVKHQALMLHVVYRKGDQEFKMRFVNYLHDIPALVQEAVKYAEETQSTIVSLNTMLSTD